MWVLVLGFHDSARVFFSAVYTGFFLVLDLRGRVLGGKVGGARWEFEDNDGGILG